MSETESFYVEVDSDVARAARGAALLHGIDIERVIANIVTKTLRDYAEKVRKAVPKLEEAEYSPTPKGPDLTEDDIPF